MGEGKKYLLFSDLNSYKIAFNLSNNVWDVVKKWDYLAIQTVGKQLISAVDSISANIAEGFGRRGKSDKIKFYYYSFGSLNESIDWVEKAFKRELLTREQYDNILGELKKMPLEINSLIKFTREKLTI